MQSTPSPKVAEGKMKPEPDSLFYRNNYFVDVRDMAGCWVVGRIIEVNPEEMVIKIRMEGTKQESVCFK